MIPRIKKAIIPVAGLGTRMLPATKAIPKELLPIYDRPIIDHVVKEAISAGITEIIFVTRSGKEAIENHFDANYELEHRLEGKGKDIILGTVKNIIPNGVVISSIRQNDALGLGHAVLCAEHLLNNEPFAVLLPDVLVLDKKNRAKNYSFSKLVNAWNDTGVGQVMVQRVESDEVQNYGIVDLGDSKSQLFKSTNICSLVEKPLKNIAPSNLAVLGRYALPQDIIPLLKKTVPGVGSEIQLTDALNDLLNLNSLNAFETDAYSFDCGNKNGFLGANIAIGSRDEKTKAYLESIIKIFFKNIEL